MPLLPGNSVLVIAGPTASGKSGLALRLARRLLAEGTRAEILCADSVTVYRGFEIGAAKPTREERAELPHHLLDLADPAEGFTAGDFVRHALPLVGELHASGAIPLLVGGTGFYLRALLRGMAVNEEEDPARAAASKARLEARAAAEGWEALHRELLARDPGSAAVVHPNDHYRILRALQAMELYGRPWSALNQEARAGGWRFPGTRFFFLDPGREELHARIAERTRAMLAAGLLEETRALLASGVPAIAKPMQSVGYKECVDTLEERESPATLPARIEQATRRLAKQQRTWFKGEKGAERVEEPCWEGILGRLGLP